LIIIALIALILWKDNGPAPFSSTIASIQNNTLSCMVLTLGLLLIKIAIVGICSARKLQGNMTEDVKASRYSMNNGFMLLMVFMSMTLLLFLTFLYLTVWFTFFNSGPATWFESTYFSTDLGLHAHSNSTIAQFKAVPMSMVQGNE
jgi:uncharacterized membrane protein